MNPRPFLRTLPLGTAALLLSCSAAHAAIGVRVLLQEWSPTAPAQQSVKQLVNEPGAVSDALQRAWREARPRICTALSNAMGKGGAANGYTLYEIKCLLDETPQLRVASASANALTATLDIGGYIEATTTTPDHLPRALDPRFSLAVKAQVVLALSVQPNLAQTLRVDRAQFRLFDATLDSHGLTGDMLKFVASDLIPFFHGPNYRQLAENAINGVGVEVASRFNASFAPVNERLRGPSGLVRVAVWGQAEAITVAFAPRELTPPGGGSMSGVFRWSAGETPGNCEGLAIAASVQTGPAPLRNATGYFEASDAPKRKIGEFRLESVGPAGECRYRLTGLATGWQNQLTLKSKLEAVASADLKKRSLRYTLKGDGWDGHNVVPLPAAQGNYLIVVSPAADAALDPELTANRRVPEVIGSRPNPAARFGSEAITSGSTVPTVVAPGALNKMQPKAWNDTNSAMPSRSPAAVKASALATPATPTAPTALSIRAQQGTAARLNPQPLPPEPPPERTGTMSVPR
jgi:hypothetical protein